MDTPESGSRVADNKVRNLLAKVPQIHSWCTILEKVAKVHCGMTTRFLDSLSIITARPEEA